MTIQTASLIQRVRAHLQEDPRIDSDAEADAEINLMSQVELVEVLSFIVDGMLSERSPGGRG